MGILLRVQKLHVRVPEFDVSVGAAAHKHLAAGRKAAGRHAGLADRAAAANNQARLFHNQGAQGVRKGGVIQARLKWHSNLYIGSQRGTTQHNKQM